jgi:hypothetical protein
MNEKKEHTAVLLLRRHVQHTQSILTHLGVGFTKLYNLPSADRAQEKQARSTSPTFPVPFHRPRCRPAFPSPPENQPSTSEPLTLASRARAPDINTNNAVRHAEARLLSYTTCARRFHTYAGTRSTTRQHPTCIGMTGRVGKGIVGGRVGHVLLCGASERSYLVSSIGIKKQQK